MGLQNGLIIQVFNEKLDKKLARRGINTIIHDGVKSYELCYWRSCRQLAHGLICHLKLFDDILTYNKEETTFLLTTESLKDIRDVLNGYWYRKSIWDGDGISPWSYDEMEHVFKEHLKTIKTAIRALKNYVPQVDYNIIFYNSY